MSSTSKPADVCAVVVTYRRPDVAARTVRSLLQQDPQPRVIVVDNAPEDAATAHLAELCERVEVVPLPGNQGFAGALCAGMQFALEAYDPEWYWLLDDDSPVQDGSLSRALSMLSRLPSGAVLANRGAMFRRGRIVKLDARGLDGPRRVPLVLVDGTVLSAEAVHRGGFPRPDLFMVFEDYEYSLRLGRAGVPLFVGPAVRSDAEHLGSLGVAPPWRAYYQTRNHLRSAIEARSLVVLVSWMTRTAKQFAYLVWRRPEMWRRTLKSRSMGTVDGLMNRMGKRVDPASEPVASKPRS